MVKIWRWENTYINPCILIYWTKVKTLHLNCVSFLTKQMQASKGNESVSECSTTGSCITVKILRMLSHGNTWKTFKCDGGPIFQVTNLNRNLSQIRPAEISFDSFRPSQQSFSYAGTGLPGLLGLMCLAQGHNAVTPMKPEPAALRSRVKHSTTEPLRTKHNELTTCLKNKLLNPYKSSVLQFEGHRQTLQTKISRHRTRRLNRVSTVCLQNALSKFE